MLDKPRSTLIPYTLAVVPRAGDREIRMKPMSVTLHEKPRIDGGETSHV